MFMNSLRPFNRLSDEMRRDGRRVASFSYHGTDWEEYAKHVDSWVGEVATTTNVCAASDEHHVELGWYSCETSSNVVTVLYRVVGSATGREALLLGQLSGQARAQRGDRIWKAVADAIAQNVQFLEAVKLGSFHLFDKNGNLYARVHRVSLDEAPSVEHILPDLPGFSDLVGRLRVAASPDVREPPEYLRRLLTAAADEIEKLQGR